MKRIDRIPNGAIAVRERMTSDGKIYVAIFSDGTTAELRK